MYSFVLALLAVSTNGSSGGRPDPERARCSHLPVPPAERAISNDNRRSAGALAGGVLTVRLVARGAAWRPDGATGCALGVRAFAEEGGRPSVPGPMIRVRAGTRVRVQVRNALASRLWVQGFQDRLGGTLDSAEVAPGETRTLEFVPMAPGAWYYSAGSVAGRIPRSDADGQLVGALVVDPATGTPPEDRVLVLTRWSPTGTLEEKGFQLNAFNGGSWPNTERLRYTVGDSVRWQVINASNGFHEMHLHGFFFRTDRRGWAIDSSTRTPGLGGMRVTAVLRPGEWLSMSFSPDRPGNWLYHCHLLAHMSGGQKLDRMPEAGGTTARHASHGGTGNHAMDDMGGLVLGLDVRPRKTTSRAPSARGPEPPRRQIALYTTRRAHVFGDHDGYSFIVKEGATVPALDSIRIPGSPIIVSQDEPVQVTVHNRLAFPISVHWHGLELESYFDGVGGFSGEGRRVAPMISPNDSFVVRFTAPRAGTYMYHVHGEMGEELAAGLYAPLLVLEPGRKYEPEREILTVVADGGPGGGKPPFINGTATPDTLQLVAGTTYLLRFHYISADDVFQNTMRGPGGVVNARQVAADGHPLTEGPLVTRPMRFNLGTGHTGDWEFTPARPGDYAYVVVRLTYETGIAVPTPVKTTLPIRVRAP